MDLLCEHDGGRRVISTGPNKYSLIFFNVDLGNEDEE